MIRLQTSSLLYTALLFLLYPAPAMSVEDGETSNHTHSLTRLDLRAAGQKQPPLQQSLLLGYAGPLHQLFPATAFSTEMHVHGSMSEGDASMASTTAESRNVGLDILWWSDHDYRITYYHHASSFNFEDWEEVVSTGESWEVRTTRDLVKKKLVELVHSTNINSFAAEITTEDAFQGNSSLKISGWSDSGDCT